MNEWDNIDYVIGRRSSTMSLHGVYIMYEVWKNENIPVFRYHPVGSTLQWLKHMPNSWTVKVLREERFSYAPSL